MEGSHSEFKPLTDSELEEMEKRVEAATPGPWEHVRDNDMGECSVGVVDDFNTFNLHLGTFPYEGHRTVNDRVRAGLRLDLENAIPLDAEGNPADGSARPRAQACPGEIQAHRDAEFIAHSRYDVHKLLAEVRHLREQAKVKPGA